MSSLKKEYNKQRRKKEYNKQRRRIQRFLRAATKRGYQFDFILEESIKNPTLKDIQRLRSITPEKLYKTANYTTPEGVVLTGKQGRHYENSQRSKKGAQTKKRKKEINDGLNADRNNARERFYKSRKIEPETEHAPATDVVLQNILEEIRRWDTPLYWSSFFTEQKENDKGILERMIEGAISTYGREEIARRLEENASRVNEIVQNILYGSGGRHSNLDINFELVSMANILNGGYLNQRESAILTGAAEYNENQ